MNQCQCVTKNGKQCERTASTEKGQNKRFCWQHQTCKNTSNKLQSPVTSKSPKRSSTKQLKNKEVVEQHSIAPLTGINELDIQIFKDVDLPTIANILITNKKARELVLLVLPEILKKHIEQKNELAKKNTRISNSGVVIKLNRDLIEGELENFVETLFVNGEMTVLKKVLDITKNMTLDETSVNDLIYTFLRYRNYDNFVEMKRYFSILPKEDIQIDSFVESVKYNGQNLDTDEDYYEYMKNLKLMIEAAKQTHHKKLASELTQLENDMSETDDV